MSDRAQVRSIEALKEAKAAIVAFGETARAALSEIDSDVSRMINWLGRQQVYWRTQLRVRREMVTRARSELYRKQLQTSTSGERASHVDEKKALDQAKAAVTEAEQKIENTKKWKRIIDREMNMYKGQTQQLARILEGETPRVIARMTRMMDNLDEYISLAPPELGAADKGGRSRAEVSASRVNRPSGDTQRQLKNADINDLRKVMLRQAQRDEIAIDSDHEPRPARKLGRPPEQIAKLKWLGRVRHRPERDEKIIVDQNIFDEDHFLFARLSEQSPGDSGWLVASAKQSSGDRPAYMAMTIEDFLRIFPESTNLLSLAPGSIIVNNHSQISAVYDNNDQDIWNT